MEKAQMDQEDRPISTEGNSPNADDLDIEKKWLQRALVDIEEFEHLYNKYRPKIYRYIRLSIKDDDAASNLTDETFSRVIDGLEKFRWKGFTFGAWVFRIAHNVVMIEFKRRYKGQEVPFDPEMHDGDSGDRPDQVAQHQQESDLIMECIDEFETIRREIFINHYGLGMTTREISLILEMPEATVKSNLQRGRQVLLKHLLAHGVDRGLPKGAGRTIKEALVREEGWDVLGEKGKARGEGSSLRGEDSHD